MRRHVRFTIKNEDEDFSYYEFVLSRADRNSTGKETLLLRIQIIRTLDLLRGSFPWIIVHVLIFLERIMRRVVAPNWSFSIGCEQMQTYPFLLNLIRPKWTQYPHGEMFLSMFFQIWNIQGLDEIIGTLLENRLRIFMQAHILPNIRNST